MRGCQKPDYEKIFLTLKAVDPLFRKILVRFFIKTANEGFLMRPKTRFDHGYIEVSRMSKDIWTKKLKDNLPMLLREEE